MGPGARWVLAHAVGRRLAMGSHGRHSGPVPGPSEKSLQEDYTRTANYFKTLADIQFKLLALVPTASASAVALVGKQESRTPDMCRVAGGNRTPRLPQIPA